MSANGRGLLDRVRDAIRSFRIDPMNAKDPALARLFDAPPAAAGIAITEANAMNLAAVWAAVNTISSTIVGLPLRLYRRLPNGGREPFTAHPLYRLLHDEPNPEQSTGQFLTCVMVNVLLTGNAYCEVERDASHRPIALWPIATHRVAPERDGAGRLVYVVHGQSGDVVIDAQDMLHVTGLSRDGLIGLSPIQCARESLGLTAATERFGGTFFGAGAHFGGFLVHPNRISAEARQNIDASITKHQGPGNAHRILLLQESMSFIERRGMPLEDAQFLATRVFQVGEVARWFNLPPHKLADLSHATYSNVEHLSIEYIRDSIVPWLRRIEQELNRKVISRLERSQQFAAFSVEGVLRGDSASRAAFYRELIRVGVMSINEARALENLNPREGADELMVDRNLGPLRLALTASADDESS